MSDTDCGCGKDKEIDYLQAERDRLIQEQRFVAEVADNRLKEIDRLKVELEKRHEKCKEDYDEVVKNRWDACADRDLWKSKCEELDKRLMEERQNCVSFEDSRDYWKSKAEKLAEALRDVLNHGFVYENGERHEADVEKAGAALAEFEDKK